jgi:signal transduction histidine kinase
MAPDTLVDLDDVVLRELARLRHDGIEVDAHAVSAAQVRGDASQLARVVANLTDNAARHATSRVAVSLREDHDRAVLTVADDGPGVAVSDRERVFERFTRLDDARSRDQGGAGLGLAIVREIVERHGGTVVVDDVPDQPSGARFTVTLPLAT